MSPSSTSSSRTFLRDVLVAVFVLVAFEAFMVRSLTIYEAKPAKKTDHAAVAMEPPSGTFVLGHRDPADFVAELREAGVSRPVIFVGDSQGASVTGGGLPYPLLYASGLREDGRDDPVVSMHVGGTNAYEQSVLLLTLLEAGIEPAGVVWAHSIFSQRKNEIRMEYTGTYHAVAGEMERLAPNAAVMDVESEQGAIGDPAQRAVAAATGSWDGVLTDLGAVRFMRRPLWDKMQILRRSDLGRLLPQSLVGGTARQFNPPASMLLGSAEAVGAMSAMLIGRGIPVVGFISPVDKQAEPKPFAPAAEAVSYPALRAALEGAGAGFLDLRNLIPHDQYSLYQDGTRDAFHFSGIGHAMLSDALGAALRDGAAGEAPAGPSP